MEFGSLEVQAVYISGNVRNPFEYYMEDPETRQNMDWSRSASYYPRPDYLSSSRKRLAPQLLYKGGIMSAWRKKQAVALQRSFYETLPELPETTREEADIVWLLYDMKLANERFEMVLGKTIYTKFLPALNRITTADTGDVQAFVDLLQSKLDKTQGGTPPDTSLLTDITLK